MLAEGDDRYGLVLVLARPGGLSRPGGWDSEREQENKSKECARKNSGAREADDQVRNDQSLFPTKLIGVTSTIATA